MATDEAWEELQNMAQAASAADALAADEYPSDEQIVSVFPQSNLSD
jgi:hypothetical protein